jgi:hypothetical protein
MSFVQSIKCAVKDGSPMLVAGETWGSLVSKHRGRRYRILIMTAKKQGLIPSNAESRDGKRRVFKVRSAAARDKPREKGRFCSKEDGVAAALPLGGAAKRPRREESEVLAAAPVLGGAAKRPRREEAKDAAVAAVLKRGGPFYYSGVDVQPDEDVKVRELIAITHDHRDVVDLTSVPSAGTYIKVAFDKATSELSAQVLMKLFGSGLMPDPKGVWQGFASPQDVVRFLHHRTEGTIEICHGIHHALLTKGRDELCPVAEALWEDPSEEELGLLSLDFGKK